MAICLIVCIYVCWASTAEIKTERHVSVLKKRDVCFFAWRWAPHCQHAEAGSILLGDKWPCSPISSHKKKRMVLAHRFDTQVWHTGLAGCCLFFLLSLSISNSVSLSTSEIWEVLKNLPRYAAFLPAQHRSRGSPPSERTSKFQLSRLCDTEKKWRDKRDTKTSHVWRKQTEISPKSADPACSRGSASEKTLQGARYGSRRTEARARSKKRATRKRQEKEANERRKQTEPRRGRTKRKLRKQEEEEARGTWKQGAEARGQEQVETARRRRSKRELEARFRSKGPGRQNKTQEASKKRGSTTEEDARRKLQD